jgi:hypothetical protein
MRAYIISLNFNPGHVSHMVAYYRQYEELGYESWMYIDKGFTEFIPADCRYIVYGMNKPEECSLAVFMFPSYKNLLEIKSLKCQKDCKIVYLFHEPLDKYSTYREAGFSWLKMLKLRVVNMVNVLTVRWSDLIFIPSMKAINYYESNHLYKNPNYHYLPLLYDDEQTKKTGKIERKFFSYIGTVAPDHSFDEYMAFVKWAILNNQLPDFNFLIATRNKVNRNTDTIILINTRRLTIFDGVPLTDVQINNFFSESIAIWNAYTRTTQSGVLAKSFMFGTPAIVLKKNLSEFVEDGKEVIAINNNTDYHEIADALVRITKSHAAFSASCRTRFLNTFYYKSFNQQVKDVLK